MKIGIIGAGSIADKVAYTIAALEEAECYAVASRSLEKAESFAKKHGFQKAYGSYEELVQDPEVELVYIATPHSHHYEHMMLCMEHGKGVLCEKAFTMNAKQAKKIAEYSKEHGVFAAEAIWTRYMPSRKLIQQVLESGVIGTPSILTANLSYIISGNDRIVNPALAGGALLDVGVYGVNFATMHFGDEIERIESSVQLTDTGVDGMESITIFYKNGRMAVLTHGIYSRSDRKGIIYGDKGYMVVENINNPQSISVYDTEDKLLEHYDMPEQISGYEYQFIEAIQCMKEGKTESISMPLADSVWVMELMDGLRQQWGVVYPQEKIRSLPERFLLGASTAAHQVEGNNIHSDYWAMEHMEYTSFNEPSLDAVDHYNRFEEDIKLMAEAGLNAYRFSIEWARIEPEQGEFDAAEIAHYRKVLECCRANGIEPIVTMHHFTSPKWLITNGGWEDETTIEAFAKYCTYVVEQLGDLMNYVCTINEANMGLQIAAIAKRYMKQVQAATAKSGAEQKEEQAKAESSVQVGINIETNPMMEKMKKQAMENAMVFGTPQPQTFVSQRTREGDILVMRAHQAAKDAMKAVKPDLKIGITLSLHDIQPQEGGEEEAAREWEEEFMHYLPYIKDDDFVGIQNYTRTLMGKEGSLPCPEGAETTQMGYEFYPEALENVIRTVNKSLSIPIMVTENGIATSDDGRRIAFIDRALKGIGACIDDGIEVLGYLHWSLLDNFEWQKGFSMTFGLISVDRNTQIRYPKESLKVLGNYLK